MEQRKDLHHYALAAKAYTQTNNADFIHGNFTQIGLANYDHFYFYNAFFENLDSSDRIDHHVSCSTNLYTYYSRYLFKELDAKPSGTRMVTFHSREDEIPPSYQVTDISMDFMLKMWVKK